MFKGGIIPTTSYMLVLRTNMPFSIHIFATREARLGIDFDHPEVAVPEEAAYA